MEQILILGSTGSIGKSTLDVIARHPERFQVFALTAATNTSLLLEQCRLFRPKIAVMSDRECAEQLKQLLTSAGLDEIEVWSGADKLTEVSQLSEVGTVMSAIVGAAGLLPTLSAVKKGKRVLIANKEPLVMTGSLFMQEAVKAKSTVLPIDSEHNAIFQCLPHDQTKLGVRKIHLTASGGPFLGRSWSELKNVQPDEACAHPNWSMGRKISIDSATMMNKGLELIEAVSLFGLPVSQVNILLHPESIIHSMVEYLDGSFLAQLGAPDMRTPIAHALSWPERIESGVQSLDLAKVAQLNFMQPDMGNLPCLALAHQAAQAGQSAPAILNAANEVAVDAFLKGRIHFTSIANIIDHTLQKSDITAVENIDHVLNIDNDARVCANSAVTSIGLQ